MEPAELIQRSRFYDLLKSRVECADFIQKLENAQASLMIPKDAEEGSSWDMVSENDLWEGGNVELDPEDYVLVGQEDIMDGIASFMAAYLLSLKQTKDLTPNQLQAALCKTFSVKNKKGKLRKAWDGSKVIYNVASWGATAIGWIRVLRIVRQCEVGSGTCRGLHEWWSYQWGRWPDTQCLGRRMALLELLLMMQGRK
ncbi:hypothetical protein PHJA_002045200 [Phtheirospermum japonicum]|uniref:Uncharacterized protein n=1 Tax=Phtheirospermum japonicum TaxID=374723 RepID=A0A830CT32_9LAMI|nr:hypothetical protein PHJA_002045200 [Phtheirospermum japonicum]